MKKFKAFRNLNMAAIMLMTAALFTACSDNDNPVDHKPFGDKDATLVTNDSELRSAITNGATVKLANDIQLSNSTLSIAEGTTVTINLDGHTLDRGLTKRGEGGGQVITIREGATLRLSNGTLKGGWGGDSGGINNEGGTANLTDVTITGCTGDDSGGGICNRSGSTLTMKGGSITNNTSNDHGDPTGGGGIFNAEGATMTLANVTITGNEAKVKGGGGICNYGTLTIDSCTIQNNIAKMNGGGIWNGKDATLSINGGNISGNTANDQGGGIYTHSSFSMQGAVNITDNKGKDGMNNNVYLTPDAVITVTGALTGSSIGLTMENATGTFTSGYNTKNSGTDPSTLFSADLTGVMAASLDANNEAQLTNALPDGEVYYVERSWNDGKREVESTIRILTDQIDFDATPTSEKQYKLLTSSSKKTMNLGTANSTLHEFYVVKGTVKVNELYLVGPNVHIILCDGSALVLGNNSKESEKHDITVTKDHTVYIHDQGSRANMGKLYNDSNSDYYGCIGGDVLDTSVHGGNIEIHGGDINLAAASYDAAIGGSYNTTGDITIYGGSIRAQGGKGAAGIGGGNLNPDFGTISIYGGVIYAKGGSQYGVLYESGGAGIGGGMNCATGKVYIYGGDVMAYGNDDDSAGIGSGQWVDDAGFFAYVIINGGTVKAYGGNQAAGIGGGDGIGGAYVRVDGGHVEAYGGEDAAGIGGGEGADGGTFIITGGYVYAKGSYQGSGIGGGSGGAGGVVTISGGTVHASAGSGDTGNRAIGPGYGSDNYGQLTIGDLLMVRAERLASAAERHDMCWYRTDVHVEPCTHPGYTTDTCPYHKH